MSFNEFGSVTSTMFTDMADAIRATAAVAFPSWPVVNEAYLDVSASSQAVIGCIAGDAAFILKNGISLLQLGKMGEMMSDALGEDMFVTTEPRLGYVSGEAAESYSLHKVRVWQKLR